MDKESLLEQINQMTEKLAQLADKVETFEVQKASEAAVSVAEVAAPSSSFISLFTAFILACFVGYYVVWSVTPALHSPLMGVTNAISSVIIVGALIAAGPEEMNLSKIFGFIAVVLASVNIFGGFVVTNRMLSMFRKKASPRGAKQGG